MEGWILTLNSTPFIQAEILSQNFTNSYHLCMGNNVSRFPKWSSYWFQSYKLKVTCKLSLPPTLFKRLFLLNPHITIFLLLLPFQEVKGQTRIFYGLIPFSHILSLSLHNNPNKKHTHTLSLSLSLHNQLTLVASC